MGYIINNGVTYGGSGDRWNGTYAFQLPLSNQTMFYSYRAFLPIIDVDSYDFELQESYIYTGTGGTTETDITSEITLMILSGGLLISVTNTNAGGRVLALNLTIRQGTGQIIGAETVSE